MKIGNSFIFRLTEWNYIRCFNIEFISRSNSIANIVRR